MCRDQSEDMTYEVNILPLDWVNTPFPFHQSKIYVVEWCTLSKSRPLLLDKLPFRKLVFFIFG